MQTPSILEDSECAKFYRISNTLKSHWIQDLPFLVPRVPSCQGYDLEKITHCIKCAYDTSHNVLMMLMVSWCFMKLDLL